MQLPHSPSILTLPGSPDDDLVFQSPLAGAALLEGWSDEGSWRILLPWPEETRELTWESMDSWGTFVQSLEAELGEGEAAEGLPFSGGWVGFISYEAMATVEKAAPRAIHPPEPAAFFARHRAGILVSPDGVALLFAPRGTLDRYQALLAGRSSHHDETAVPVSDFQDSLGGGAYERGVEAIREMIREGDVYQVNLTRAFSVESSRDAASVHRALTGPNPPRSSAFLRGSGWSIASASPEVLLDFDRTRGVAESRPIKGTVRRRGDDRDGIAELVASDKDAAEHLMIVDVVRNDLGKIAPPGSVSVREFRAVRTLEHVHHLESTVRADGLRDAQVSDILVALAPAASITGAPKRAAVHAIREIEPVARGVYCGAIGMLRPDGATFSVAIRTAVVTGDAVRYHAGGGIVWDSDGAAEEDESRAKSAAFLRYFGLEESCRPSR